MLALLGDIERVPCERAPACFDGQAGLQIHSMEWVVSPRSRLLLRTLTS